MGRSPGANHSVSGEANHSPHSKKSVASVVQTGREASKSDVAIVYFDDRHDAKRNALKLWFSRTIYVVLFSAVVIALTAGIVNLLWRPSVESENEPTEPVVVTMPTFSPTFAPTSANLKSLLDVLEVYTEASALADKDSPQFKAARWLAMDSVYLYQPEEESTMRQRYSLAVFYFAMDGDSWLECSRFRLCHKVTFTGSPWLRDTDECTWQGIQCNEEGSLVKIEIVNSHEIRDTYTSVMDAVSGTFPMEMAGMLPSEIQLWTNLKEITLKGLSLHGPIDGLLTAGLSHLEVVDLAENMLSGSLPDHLWVQNPILRSLDLSGNKLYGFLPEGMNAASNLGTLDLGRNNFNGSIPTLFSKSLESLTLRGNQLTGGIPTEIGTLERLVSLDLRETALSGGIPSELYHLESLKSLKIDHTPIGGVLSEEVVHLCDTIQVLSLENANLTGTLPTTIANCTLLKELSTWENPLMTGTVPDQTCELVETDPGSPLSLSIRMACGVECRCCYGYCHSDDFD